MSYCSHCGSENAPIVPSPNKGYTMYVAEESDCATECYDPDIAMLKCNDCDGVTYKSVVFASGSLPSKPKTSRIGPNDLNYPQAPIKGAAPVQWLIDGEWVHKGWLLPQVTL